MGQQPRRAQYLPKSGTVVRFKVGQPVEGICADSNVLVRAVGEPKLSLAQKLATVSIPIGSGAVHATTRVGRELF